MIRIVKEGKIPNPAYQLVCPICETVFEATIDEFTHSSIVAFGNSISRWAVSCPYCKYISHYSKEELDAHLLLEERRFSYYETN